MSPLQRWGAAVKQSPQPPVLRCVDLAAGQTLAQDTLRALRPAGACRAGASGGAGYQGINPTCHQAQPLPCHILERFRVRGLSLEGNHANSVGAAGHDEVDGNPLDLGAIARRRDQSESMAAPSLLNTTVRRSSTTLSA
jgi:hypothetical protein